MVVLQALNKILATKDMQLVIDNNLTKEMFEHYENEFEFIDNFYKTYGKVPDKETFLNKFNDFTLLEVTESDRYLVDKINEEYLYAKTVPVIQQTAELLKENSKNAVDFLLEQLPKLTLVQSDVGVDIVQEAHLRYEEYLKKQNQEETFYISTGFEELDTIFNGFSHGEELVVLFARIGQGKSWVLNKMLASAWQQGLNVGLISPEMSANKIGYRFDTLVNHFSNTNLVWGKEEMGYQQYIENLPTNQNKYVVAVPQDFERKITVSKLKTFCQKNKLDILGIDGITYLSDERAKRGDNRTTMLTNISEDLMSLSIELQIPILVVVQSNRGGVNKDENSDTTPDLENIKDSDGIAANASKVIAIRQKTSDKILQLGIKKHRDGITGQTLLYQFDFNSGDFTYIPSSEDGVKGEHKTKAINKLKKDFPADEDVF